MLPERCCSPESLDAATTAMLTRMNSTWAVLLIRVGPHTCAPAPTLGTEGGDESLPLAVSGVERGCCLIRQEIPYTEERCPDVEETNGITDVCYDTSRRAREGPVIIESTFKHLLCVRSHIKWLTSIYRVYTTHKKLSAYREEI